MKQRLINPTIIVLLILSSVFSSGAFTSIQIKIQNQIPLSSLEENIQLPKELDGDDWSQIQSILISNKDWDAVSSPDASSIVQQAYFKASNTDWMDQFGFSVAVSGNTVVVGAPTEDSNATGVNGNQDNNSADSAGAAYVFVHDGTSWNQQAYLKASNTATYNSFGHSVAISGDTVVIGAFYAETTGAAYIFVRNGTDWSQQAYLRASSPDTGDHFGESVDISGDTVVVGANYEDSSDTGVNGNEDDNTASAAGAAYVFVRSGTTWSQQAYLKASNTDAFDEFGHSVAISGDTVVVGAWGEGSDAIGVNGGEGDNTEPMSGAAYVFVRDGTTWSQQAYLKASNTSTTDEFGRCVAASGDTVVVGARYEDSNASGVNGEDEDDSMTDAGAAYVFVRNGTTWNQEAYLKASNPDVEDEFGSKVALFGNTVVIGALYEDSNAKGINGDEGDDSASSAGAAYIFTREGTSWSQVAYLKGSNTDAGDYFGQSVAVDNDTVMVGAIHEASSDTGVNGDEEDNTCDSGAAYAFVTQNTIYLPIVRK